MNEIPKSLWKHLLWLTSGAAPLCKYRNVRTLLSETERKPFRAALIDSQYKPAPADPQKEPCLSRAEGLSWGTAGHSPLFLVQLKPRKEKH